ncbi:MAG: M28 family peptidase [Candidatus Hermodarchaeota archaeon]
MDIGFRIPGTEERVNCAHYFINKFQAIDSNFTYVLHNFTVQSIECQNILFKLNQNHNNIVILGAHYDSRAKATKDPNPINRSDPVPGANDAASGSAVLIELARVLYLLKDNLSCQIWFLFFDAEDQGVDSGGPGMTGWDWCEGSEKFVSDINDFYNNHTETFECMILLDMVGGVNLRFINELYSTSSLLDELFAIGRALGYTSQFPSNPIDNRIIDDHRAFLKICPAADLIINFWDNPNWQFHHTISDNITYIRSESLQATGRTVEQFIYNNYLDIPNKDYNGNYPWTKDVNLQDLEMIVIFITTIIVIAIAALMLNVIKYDPTIRN